MDRIQPPYRTILPTQDTLFSCGHTSDVVWSFNGGSLPHNSNVVQSEDKRQYHLMLYRVGFYDLGEYKCAGELHAGYTEFYDIAALDFYGKLVYVA